MSMKTIHSALSGVLLGMAFLPVQAADFTFPSAGGNLASATEWGGTLPGTGDKIKIDQAGDYTLSGDVTFNSFYVSIGGCNFTFGNHSMTASASSGRGFGVEPIGGAQTVFSGGLFDLSGTANIQACNVAPVESSTVVFTNNCVVTNVNYFIATRGCKKNAKVSISGGSKVYAKELYVAYDGGTEGVLDIYDGGQVHVTSRIYSEANGTVNSYAGHTLRVSGEGSRLNYTAGNNVSWGFRQSCNTLMCIDGGTVNFSGTGGINLGGSGSNVGATGNVLFVEHGATAIFPIIRSNTDYNRIFVGDGASLTTAKLLVSSRQNEIILSNATLSCSSTDFSLATVDNSTGNVFRAIGSDSSLALPESKYWFQSGHHNMFSLEGGIKLNVQCDALFTNSQHSVFRVTGAETEFGDSDGGLSNRFYIGDKNNQVTDACASNVLEVSDGAVFHSNNIYLMGIGNALVVSNGTVNIYTEMGLRAGYRDASRNSTNTIGSVVRLCGEKPKIKVSSSAANACMFANQSILRFEIPEVGYAKGHVPISADGTFKFDATCRLEIDCAAFARSGGRRLSLVEAGSDITEEVGNNLLANVRGLPEGSRLKISGRTVQLICPRSFIMSFR